MVLVWSGVFQHRGRASVLVGLLALIGGLGVGAASAGARYVKTGPLLITRDRTDTWYVMQVAMSADGSTVAIGRPGARNAAGAVWVFARSGSSWVRQSTVVPRDENGRGAFGESLALSSDGDTLLVGGATDGPPSPNQSLGHPVTNIPEGAAWVFVRTGSDWAQQGPKLTGDTGVPEGGGFGGSVGLSADGDEAVITDRGRSDGQNFPAGRIWTFARSSGAWSTVGTPVDSPGDPCCHPAGVAPTIALSGDGQTLLLTTTYQDSAWVFRKASGQWTAQHPALMPSGDPCNGGQFGVSAAISADASTVIIGDPSGPSRCPLDDRGEAFAFSDGPGGWAQDGAPLIPDLSAGSFGGSGTIGLTADGRRAVIAASTAAGEFARTNSGWTQEGPALPAPGSGFVIGRNAAMSADGSSVLLTAPNQNRRALDAAVGYRWVNCSFTKVDPKLKLVRQGSSTRQGLLTASVGCDNASSPQLTGQITILPAPTKHHRHPAPRRVRLAGLGAAVGDNETASLKMHVPPSVITALKAKAKASLSLTISEPNAATPSVSTKVSRLSLP